MFTSRAEYRLLLRSDNADLRLSSRGHGLGLISEKQLKQVEKKQEEINRAKEALRTTFIKSTEAAARLLDKISGNNSKKHNSGKLADLLRRPEVDCEQLIESAPLLQKLSGDVLRQVEIEVKYEGYIKKQLDQINRYKNMEEKTIPADFNYKGLPSLSYQAREKLSRVAPTTLGQASRVSGVTPADISVLMICLGRLGSKRKTKIGRETT